MSLRRLTLNYRENCSETIKVKLLVALCGEIRVRLPSVSKRKKSYIMNKYFEVEFETNEKDNPTICIIGIRKPSIHEVEQFCAEDMEQFNYDKVIAVRELTEREACKLYNMEDIIEFPVFT